MFNTSTRKRPVELSFTCLCLGNRLYFLVFETMKRVQNSLNGVNEYVQDNNT